MDMNTAVETAVGRAIQTVKDEDDHDPSAQPAVIGELAETEFAKIVEDDDWEWEEVTPLIQREIKRRV